MQIRQELSIEAPLVDDLRADLDAWIPDLSLVAEDDAGRAVGGAADRPVGQPRLLRAVRLRPLADHDSTITGTFRYAAAFG